MHPTSASSSAPPRTSTSNARGGRDPHYSPLRYPGGKSPLLPQARAWLRAQGAAHLVEPFAGGASVGLAALCEGLVERLPLVERDGEVAHFWETVFSPVGHELAARVLAVPKVAALHAAVEPRA